MAVTMTAMMTVLMTGDTHAARLIDQIDIHAARLIDQISIQLTHAPAVNSDDDVSDIDGMSDATSPSPTGSARCAILCDRFLQFSLVLQWFCIGFPLKNRAIEAAPWLEAPRVWARRYPKDEKFCIEIDGFRIQNDEFRKGNAASTADSEESAKGDQEENELEPGAE